VETKAIVALITIPNILGISISVLLAIFNIPSPTDFLIQVGQQTVSTLNSTFPTNAPPIVYSITANNLFAIRLLGFVLAIETPLNIVLVILAYLTRDE
jgi:hypothetical protein